MRKIITGALKTFLPFIAVAAAIAVSLMTGKFNIDWSSISDLSGLDARVFFNLRVGRTLTVLLSGTALGIAGYVFQTVFRNPLASPDVVGVAGGASVGAAIGMIIFTDSIAATPLMAFAGGMLAVALVLLLDSVTGSTGISSLVICGVCVNALFQAVLTFLKVTVDRDNKLAAIEYWLAGSFSDATLKTFCRMLPGMTAGIVCLGFISRPVRLLMYNDDEAAMLGVPVKVMRVAAISLSTLIVGCVVSAAGLISFVGLLAPHIARLTKTGRKHGMPYSALAGALLLITADILARCVGVNELPVSVMTSIIGVPVLFILLYRRNVHER